MNMYGHVWTPTLVNGSQKRIFGVLYPLVTNAVPNSQGEDFKRASRFWDGVLYNVASVNEKHTILKKVPERWFAAVFWGKTLNPVLPKQFR